jgi:superfamily I DNA/RNA helicase
MAPHFHHYYGQIIKKHGNLTPNTKIRICTMHASKGREADRVILINGMGMRTEQAFDNDKDSEYRTFYVAVTRSRYRLDIVQETAGLGVLM